jgi:hypothetical protein
MDLLANVPIWADVERNLDQKFSELNQGVHEGLQSAHDNWNGFTRRVGNGASQAYGYMGGHRIDAVDRAFALSYPIIQMDLKRKWASIEIEQILPVLLQLVKEVSMILGGSVAVGTIAGGAAGAFASSSTKKSWRRRSAVGTIFWSGGSIRNIANANRQSCPSRVAWRKTIIYIVPAIMILTTITLLCRDYTPCPKLLTSGSAGQLFWVNQDNACFKPTRYINDNWPYKTIGNQEICIRADGINRITRTGDVAQYLVPNRRERSAAKLIGEIKNQESAWICRR